MYLNQQKAIYSILTPEVEIIPVDPNCTYDDSPVSINIIGSYSDKSSSFSEESLSSESSLNWNTNISNVYDQTNEGLRNISSSQPHNFENTLFSNQECLGRYFFFFNIV